MARKKGKKKKNGKKQEPKEPLITVVLNEGSANMIVESLRQSRIPSEDVLPLAAVIQAMMTDAKTAWDKKHKGKKK